MQKILWPEGKPVKVICGEKEVCLRTNPGKKRRLTSLVQEGASRLGQKINKEQVTEMIKQGSLKNGSLVLTIPDAKP